MEQHNATQPDRRGDRPDPDVVSPAVGAPAGNGASLGHLADPQRRAVAEAKRDLTIVAAYEEVRDARGFDATRDLRRHLLELVRVLSQGARSTEEGGP